MEGDGFFGITHPKLHPSMGIICRFWGTRLVGLAVLCRWLLCIDMDLMLFLRHLGGGGRKEIGAKQRLQLGYLRSGLQLIAHCSSTAEWWWGGTAWHWL